MGCRKNSRLLSTPSDRFDQAGTTILETAIILPFIVFMVFATFELGKALNEYLVLTRVVYEGARYAATLPGLESGVFLTPTSGNTPVALPQNHALVTQRVQDLIRRLGFDPASCEVESTFADSTRIGIIVHKPYHSLFGIFGDMRIRVEASGPYLSSRPEKS